LNQLPERARGADLETNAITGLWDDRMGDSATAACSELCLEFFRTRIIFESERQQFRYREHIGLGVGERPAPRSLLPQLLDFVLQFASPSSRAIANGCDNALRPIIVSMGGALSVDFLHRHGTA
jgi:hypothetical protein